MRRHRRRACPRPAGRRSRQALAGRRRPAGVEQQRQERLLAVELGRDRQVEQCVVGVVAGQRRPLSGSASSSACSTLWQAISFSRLVISSGVRGTPGRRAGCARTSSSSRGGAGRQQRLQRRVAGIAAVPIGAPADLHRGKHEGQAARGQQHVDGDRGVLEQHRLAGLHVGGGDDQPRRGRIGEQRRARPGRRAGARSG